VIPETQRIVLAKRSKIKVRSTKGLRFGSDCKHLIDIGVPWKRGKTQKILKRLRGSSGVGCKTTTTSFSSGSGGQGAGLVPITGDSVA
jgi:hypothetical protein